MESDRRSTRRKFLEGTAAAIGGATDSLNAQTGGQVPHRPFGKTGVQVSALGVGGYHLGSAEDSNEARRIVDAALDAGIDYLTTRGSITKVAARSGWVRR